MRSVSVIDSGANVLLPRNRSGRKSVARIDATVSVAAVSTSYASIVTGAVGRRAVSWAAIGMTSSALSTSVIVLSVEAAPVKVCVIVS